MKDYRAPNIRNVAVTGPPATGKTMLCEAILRCTGRLDRMGEIEQGSTVSDFHQDEKDHQISVHASVLASEWLGREVNLIDCPGTPDFISEPLSAVRVTDSAMVVVSGVNGVEVGADEVWAAAEDYGIPRFIVVNMLDRDRTRFDEIIEEAREHYGPKVIPFTLPVDEGPGFRSVLDVMRSEVITFAADGSPEFEEKPAEGELKERVNALHRELIDLVAESDDTLLEEFLEKGTLSEESLRKHVHQAFQMGLVIPVFATSATTNVGVTRVLDFIAKYGSSPVDRATVKGEDPDGGEVKASLDDSEALAFVFKTMHEPHVGTLSFFRVYSGDVVAGSELRNESRNETERLGQIYRVNGSEREPTPSLHAGDIGAAVKLRVTHCGDTLSAPARPLKLPVVDFPQPNTSGAFVVRSRADSNKLGEGLSMLREQDPTFDFHHDPVLGQTIVSGQGEIQLQIIVEELKRRFNVEVDLVEPGVAFRSTITKPADARYRHKKQSGGAGQFAEVWMRIAPLPAGEGVVFTQSLVGNNVDRVFVPSVEKGVQAACEAGPFGGFPVTDVKIDFYDGKQHPVDSKDIAFQIAGKGAFNEAFLAASPKLLEPVAELRIKVPSDAVGGVLADLSGRRGNVLGMETEGRFEVVIAHVPQSELFRYSSQLRAITAGRGRHSECFDHYQEVPKDVESKIIAEADRKRRDNH
ncbi:elongation factor G [Haloferula sp. A504]|uniref:elongation factor G n=1 Tax=Haloferula sp. A504 TaxID=3373601 RepID=UPI0031CB7962|nr:elongation factor G [Verrucomicrobiaceae bacterium E54]